MTVALTWVGFVALVVVPVPALRRLGAAWKWFALGVLSWVIAVVAKTLLQAAADAALGPASRPAQAAVSGLISAGAELGMAAWFLRRAEPRLPNVLAFGAGIGVFEAVFVLLLGWLEGLDDPAARGAAGFAFVDGAFVTERLLALIGHTASRVLLYVGLGRGRPSAAFLSIALFSCVDGAAKYGLLAGWDWDDPSVRTRFNSFVAAVVGLEVAAAWWFGARAAGWWRAAEPTQI